MRWRLPGVASSSLTQGSHDGTCVEFMKDKTLGTDGSSALSQWAASLPWVSLCQGWSWHVCSHTVLREKWCLESKKSYRTQVEIKGWQCFLMSHSTAWVFYHTLLTARWFYFSSPHSLWNSKSENSELSPLYWSTFISWSFLFINDKCMLLFLMSTNWF